MSVEIYIVRHGRTMANTSGRIQGQSDTPLSPLGIRQAEALAKRLAGLHFDAVFSSDLNRAMKTARIITGNSVPVQPSPELREMDLGRWVGRDVREIMQEFPDEYAGIHCGDPATVIEGGESCAQVMERTGLFLERIASELEGKKVLIVSHGVAIRTMFLHILGMRGPLPRMPRVDNASLSTFLCHEGRWQLVCWNDTSHLGTLTSEPDRY